MLTGKQIREARALLGLQRSKFAERAGIPHAMLKLAEMTDGECPITIGRANQIRRAIEAAGIELYGDGEQSGARRKPATGRRGGAAAEAEQAALPRVDRAPPALGEDP